MLTGVGCDLIELERVKKACEKEAFLSRVYTEEERRQADGKISMLAGTFAVKEAVAKVLGTGFRTFMPIDVEVLRDELGNLMWYSTETRKNWQRKRRSAASRFPFPIRKTMSWHLPWGKERQYEISGKRTGNERD